MGYVTTISKDIDIDVDVDDIKGFIDELSTNQFTDVLNYMVQMSGQPTGGSEIEDTLEMAMKGEWWELARKKYTLEQLENVLGNKFTM